MATFRNVEFRMRRGNGYGQYVIEARYRGEDIKAYTTDSEAWDWINDDSNKEKHQDALRHCYRKIVEAYNEKTITAYRQGGNWIVNINGYEDQLHYSIKSKADVRRWLAERQNEHEYEGYRLVFA